MKTWSTSAFLGFFLAVALSVPGTAAASTKASPDSCAAVGSAVLQCYNCSSRVYLGKTSVLTSYEESGGEGYCVKANEGKAACAYSFGVPQNVIGFYTKFKIGWGSRDETYDTNCVKSIGIK